MLHFDAIAYHYDSSLPPHIVHHYLEKRARFIERTIPRGSHILDVGCGTGRLAARLHEAGYHMTGIDRAHAMLRQARARELECVAQAGAECLPFPSDCFDAAISVALLHHLETPEAVAATLAEMVRVVRPAGLCVIWDHNPWNPYWPILMRRVPQDRGDERLVPAREIIANVRRAGAQVIYRRRLGFVPDFIPPALLPFFRALEYIVERLPGLNLFCAHNVLLVKKSARPASSGQSLPSEGASS